MKNIKSIFTKSLIGQHHDLQPIGSTAVQQISMSPNRQQLAVVESHAGCHIASHADCHNCLTYAVCQPLLFSSLKHRLLMSSPIVALNWYHYSLMKKVIKCYVLY